MQFWRMTNDIALVDRIRTMRQCVDNCSITRLQKELAMSKLRTLITVFLCIILFISGCSAKDSIQFTAQINRQLTLIDNQPLPEISKLTIRVSEDQSHADVILTVDGGQLKSRCKCVIYDYGKAGKYGILDGEIRIHERTVPVTVDMYYISGKENFSAVTIGAIGDEYFSTRFFGKQTDKTNTLASMYIERK